MSVKVLYLFDASDWESRMAVAYEAQQQGFDVVVGLLHGDEKSKKRAAEFEIHTLRGLAEIYGLIKRTKPDFLHVVTLKYSLLAGLAALPFPKMGKLYTLAGLGYVFRSSELKSKILQFALRPLLTFVFRYPNTQLIFQNQDDLDLLVDQSYVRAKSVTLIKGSGVYLDRFVVQSSAEEAAPIVLMPTRLVHDKGIAVFVEAARRLKKQGSNAVFQIAGGITKHNPRAITEAEMEAMTEDGVVEWLGRVDDLPEHLSRASLIVYPSHYGEGIPRVLLEACAAGRAIVTTDHPGCREAVDDGENGLFVPVKDPQKTAEAIERLLDDRNLLRKMENNSRQKAEDEFNIHKIVGETVNIYKKFDL